MAKDSKTRGTVLSSLRRVAKKASKNSQRFTNLTGQLARALSKVRVKRFKSTLARALSKVRVKRFKSTLARALSKVRVKRFKSKAPPNVSNDVDARAENNIPMAQDLGTLSSDNAIEGFLKRQRNEEFLKSQRDKSEAHCTELAKWISWIRFVIRDAILRIGLYWGVPAQKSELNVLEDYMNYCKNHPLEQEHVKLLCLLFQDECRSHFRTYLNIMVLTFLRGERGKSLPGQLVGRWSNLKEMIKWLSQFFDCLNPNSIALPPVLPLNKVGVSYFCELVFLEFSVDVTKAVIYLIGQESGGELDHALLNEIHFKAHMLEDTISYYSRMDCMLERMDSPQRMDLDEWMSWIILVSKDAIHHIGSYSGVPKQESLLNVLDNFRNFCKEHPPEQEHVTLLCARFREKCRFHFQTYLNRLVPFLRGKRGESLLRELVQRWSNHKVMFEWLSKFSDCLNPNSYFIPVQPLNEIGVSCFHDVVLYEFSKDVTEAVIFLIDQEREGKQIDQALLQNVLNIFVEIGLDLKYYEKYFEEPLLRKTELYYKDKASKWISYCSFTSYNQKVKECLKREKDRVDHYLHFSSVPKLLEIVEHELTVHAAQLYEKEHPGCYALLRDGKLVTDEVTTLLKQAEDAASNKGSPELPNGKIRDLEREIDFQKSKVMEKDLVLLRLELKESKSSVVFFRKIVVVLCLVIAVMFMSKM